MFRRLGSFRIFALLVTATFGLNLIGYQPVLAKGEKYTLNSSGNILTITGGNVSVVQGSDELDLSKFESPISPNAYRTNFKVSSGEGGCPTGNAWIEIYTIPSDKLINLINSGCGTYDQTESGTLYDGYDTWDTGVKYTQGGGGGGTTPPDTSGKETYEFIGTDGTGIKACGGLFKQFKDDCLNLIYDQAASGGPVASVAEFIYPKQASTDFTSCTVNFVIGIAQDRPTQDDNMEGFINIDGAVAGDGCGDFERKGLLGDASNNQAILISGVENLEDFIGGPIDPEEEDPESLCQVTGGMAWILCPIMNTVASINDEAYKLIENFLQIPPMMTDGSNTGAFQVWSSVRNIANVLFAIAFIFIVYSQLTSAGISNYGIKKMLPKLLVGVILVNISFWIVALMVDLSNVIGSSIYEVMKGFIPAPADGTLNSWQGVTGEILGNGALLAGIAGGAVMIGFSVLLPLGISALFMLVGLLFILTFRHAMVFILAVIAPLAFVAYLLPNTEGMFKSWFKLFRVLLYIYPAVGFIMGASQVAAAVVFATAQEAEAGVTKLTMMLIAVAMPAMGIFAALMLAKTMGSVMSKLGVQNPFSGVINAAKERAGATGRNMDGATSNWMAGRRGLRRIGGVGQARREARDFKQQMRDSRYKNDAQARALGQQRKKYFGRKEDGSFGLLNGVKGVGKDSLNTQLDASKQRLANIQTEAEITAMKTNEKLHADATIENLALGTAKSQITDSVNTMVASNVDGAADRAGLGDTVATQRAQSLAQYSLEKREQEVIEQAQSRIDGFDDERLKSITSGKDKEFSSETDRLAAAGVIAGRNFRGGHNDLIDYMTDEDNYNNEPELFRKMQLQTMRDGKGNLSIAVGDQDKGKLGIGDMKKSKSTRSVDSTSGKPLSVTEDLMLKRLEDDNFSLTSFANMNPDDAAILTKLQSKGALSDKARSNINNYVTELEKPENSQVYSATKEKTKQVFEKVRRPNNSASASTATNPSSSSSSTDGSLKIERADPPSVPPTGNTAAPISQTSTPQPTSPPNQPAATPSAPTPTQSSSPSSSPTQNTPPPPTGGTDSTGRQYPSGLPESMRDDWNNRMNK